MRRRLVTADTDQDHTNKAAQWMLRRPDDEAFSPQSEEFVDEHTHVTLYFVEVLFLGPGHDAGKYHVRRTVPSHCVSSTICTHPLPLAYRK